MDTKPESKWILKPAKPNPSHIPRCFSTDLSILKARKHINGVTSSTAYSLSREFIEAIISSRLLCSSNTCWFSSFMEEEKKIFNCGRCCWRGINWWYNLFDCRGCCGDSARNCLPNFLLPQGRVNNLPLPLPTCECELNFALLWVILVNCHVWWMQVSRVWWCGLRATIRGGPEGECSKEGPGTDCVCSLQWPWQAQPSWQIDFCAPIFLEMWKTLLPQILPHQIYMWNVLVV